MRIRLEWTQADPTQLDLKWVQLDLALINSARGGPKVGLTWLGMSWA